MLKAKDDETKAELFKQIKESVDKLSNFLSENETPFICGDSPGMTDFMVWPHLERVSILTPAVIQDDMVKAYVARMENDSAVKSCRHTNELHQQFFEMIRKGEYNYDIGDVSD